MAAVVTGLAAYKTIMQGISHYNWFPGYTRHVHFVIARHHSVAH